MNVPSINSASRDLTIYSVAACPYAQRTRILLGIKNIDAKLVELDLSKKRPDWFLAINPAGKVPAIVHGGRPLNESSVINEYLEETFPYPPVFPADPYQKAFSRMLIDYCNTSFATNMYRLLMEQDTAKRPRIVAAANKDWEWLNDMLTRLEPGTQVRDHRVRPGVRGDDHDVRAGYRRLGVSSRPDLYPQ